MTQETLDNELIGEKSSQESSEPKVVYPDVADRVKAIVLDSFVMVAFMMIGAVVFSFYEDAPESARIMVFCFIVLVYDPLFTSLFGGTIGHMIIGIRVKRENGESRNILFPLAVIRSLIKLLLGWVSLLTVSGTRKRKAIHDLIVGSVVVYNKKALVEAGT